MRKKIIIFVIGLVLVLACFFEYSNYQNKIDLGYSVFTVLESVSNNNSDGDKSDTFQLEDSPRVLTLNIDTECGQFTKQEDGSYSNDMKKVPNKGSIIIKIKDDESNVIKNFTIKGGDSFSKTMFLGKGKYNLEVIPIDGFEGNIKYKTCVWKLI